MEIVAHRINSIAGLREVPVEFGTEIDIRADGSTLVLNHEPFLGGERLTDYMDEYRHRLLVLNIKEAGIEDEVLRIVRAHGVALYFLLDVEFPYIYRAARRGERAIAMRFSEEESLETVLHYQGKVDWVWIDTISRLPLDAKNMGSLLGFKSCLVCPERWGRPQDIIPYAGQMRALGYWPDAVMTSLMHARLWKAAAHGRSVVDIQ